MRNRIGMLSVVVDPPTPFVEIVRTTLVRDVLKRSNSNPVVHRNGDGSDFARVRVRVFEDRVASTLAILPVIETGENAYHVLTGEIA